jgi:hypothetical protein
MFSITSIITKISILYLFFNINKLNAYEGEGTFYGGDATMQGTGSCMLKQNFNSITNTVAMNRAQYEEGASCGKCVEINLELDSLGQPLGIGVKPLPFKIIATIDNECPECKFGDVDFGFINDGEKYDGRWKINWDFVQCINGKNMITNDTRIGNLRKV